MSKSDAAFKETVASFSTLVRIFPVALLFHGINYLGVIVPFNNDNNKKEFLWKGLLVWCICTITHNYLPPLGCKFIVWVLAMLIWPCMNFLLSGGNMISYKVHSLFWSSKWIVAFLIKITLNLSEKKGLVMETTF